MKLKDKVAIITGGVGVWRLLSPSHLRAKKAACYLRRSTAMRPCRLSGRLRHLETKE